MAKRQLEKRVNRHTTRINGCYTRWRYDDRSLARVLHDSFQKRRLARSRLACQKYAAPRAFDKVPCRAQLVVLLHIYF